MTLFWEMMSPVSWEKQRRQMQKHCFWTPASFPFLVIGFSGFQLLLTLECWELTHAFKTHSHLLFNPASVSFCYLQPKSPNEHGICCCLVTKLYLTLCDPIVHQASLSMGFARQEYWSGLPCPPPGDLPDPGIESTSSVLAGRFFTTEPPGKPEHGITPLIYALPFFIPLLPGFQMSYLYDRNHAQESGYTQNPSLTLPQCQTSSLSTGKLGCFATVTRSFHIPPEHSPTALLTTLRGVHLEIKMWPLLTISPQTYGKSREYKSWVSHFVPAPRAQQASWAHTWLSRWIDWVMVKRWPYISDFSLATVLHYKIDSLTW